MENDENNSKNETVAPNVSEKDAILLDVPENENNKPNDDKKNAEIEVENKPSGYVQVENLKEFNTNSLEHNNKADKLDERKVESNKNETIIEEAKNISNEHKDVNEYIEPNDDISIDEIGKGNDEAAEDREAVEEEFKEFEAEIDAKNSKEDNPDKASTANENLDANTDNTETFTTNTKTKDEPEINDDTNKHAELKKVNEIIILKKKQSNALFSESKYEHAESEYRKVYLEL